MASRRPMRQRRCRLLPASLSNSSRPSPTSASRSRCASTTAAGSGLRSVMPTRGRSQTKTPATESSSSRTPTVTTSSTPGRSSRRGSTSSVVWRWGLAACGWARRPISFSSPTPTATTSPTASLRSCSTAGAHKTPTKRSIRSSGGPMAGSMAATACSRIRPSAGRARPRPNERESTPASGGTIRCGMSSRFFPKARAIRGVWTSTIWGMRFRRRASFHTSTT